MKTRLWLAGSVIAAWQLLSSPQFPWTPSAPLILLVCIVGTVFCILVLPVLVRLGTDTEALVHMACLIYIPVYFMAQHPVQLMDPRYVALTLGGKQSLVYPIGSQDSKYIEPHREDDGYRELHYYRFWQTARVLGFDPRPSENRESKRFPFGDCLIVAVFERTVGMFPYWVALSALLGIYFFINSKRGQQKESYFFQKQK